MEFKLEQLDNAIYLFMHDKPNSLVDINIVYLGCQDLCPELKNNTVTTFNTYLDKALQNYEDIKLLKYDSDVSPKRYLVFLKDSNQSLMNQYDLKDITFDFVEHTTNLENKYNKVLVENTLLKDKCQTLSESNTNLEEHNKLLLNENNALINKCNDISLKLINYEHNNNNSQSFCQNMLLFSLLVLIMSFCLNKF
ncbi:hypothetical protein Catovirus_1_710 [Catovirus CTV1]|uniref:Uncharacterized protein n=1 Tax=Catovirus CTV1 TaxID=1977631 RepID=A0A1V0SAB7_9VIRU|nr:hypothetical protein Catovirus_1_710 [Catovirus CTV1]